MTWCCWKSLNCTDYDFRQVVLPFSYFFLCFSVFLGLAAVFNMEWIYVNPDRQSATYRNATVVYNGFYVICMNGCFITSNEGGAYVVTECSDGHVEICQNLDFSTLGTRQSPDCYSTMKETYSLVSGLIFGGAGMCFFTGMLVYYRRRRLTRKPHRYVRDKRRTTCSAFVTAVLYLVAFIIFIISSGNKYNCDEAYGLNGGYGTPFWMVIAAFVMTALVTWMMWFCDMRPPKGFVKRKLRSATELEEIQIRSSLMNEELADFEAWWKECKVQEARLQNMGAFFFWQSQEQVWRLALDRVEGYERNAIIRQMDAEGQVIREKYPLYIEPAPVVGIPLHTDGLVKDVHGQSQSRMDAKDPVVPDTEPLAKPPPVVRPTLGIEIKVSEGTNDQPTMVIAHRVLPDGPADTAGIQAGDVIASWNGRAVESKQVFARCLKQAVVGEVVSLGLVREDQSIQLEVEIGGVVMAAK